MLLLLTTLRYGSTQLFVIAPLILELQTSRMLLIYAGDKLAKNETLFVLA
jgi:hypothetical protein